MGTAVETYATGRRVLAAREAAGGHPAAFVPANIGRTREQRILRDPLVPRLPYDYNLAELSRTARAKLMSRHLDMEVGSSYLLTSGPVRTSSSGVAADEDFGSGQRFTSDVQSLTRLRDPWLSRCISSVDGSLHQGTAALPVTSSLLAARKPSSAPVRDLSSVRDHLRVPGRGDGPLQPSDHALLRY